MKVVNIKWVCIQCGGTGNRKKSLPPPTIIEFITELMGAPDIAHIDFVQERCEFCEGKGYIYTRWGLLHLRKGESAEWD